MNIFRTWSNNFVERLLTGYTDPEPDHPVVMKMELKGSRKNDPAKMTKTNYGDDNFILKRDLHDYSVKCSN